MKVIPNIGPCDTAVPQSPTVEPMAKGKSKKSKEQGVEKLKESIDGNINAQEIKITATMITVETKVIEQGMDLEEENRLLRGKMEELSRKLEEASEVNNELTEAKSKLSAEIEDLTKVLFEEANGMVANEVKARMQLEATKRKIQAELESTKDQLRVESQQLIELKQRLSDTCSTPSLLDFPSSPVSLSGGYFEVLFPDRRFNSRARCDGPFASRWDEIIRSLDVATFQAFARFCENIGKLADDAAVLGNPFVRKIYENDVVPCLDFDSKPRSFIKKLVLAMFGNTCMIERVSPSSPLPSPIVSPSSASMSQESSTEDVGKLNTIFNELTLSFSALPDIFVLDANAITGKPSKPSSSCRFCALCGIPLDVSQPIYRLKLLEKDPVMLVDEPCRDRLVAAAEFYTFLRYLRKGLYSNRPIIDLYYELLHFLRNMFYARTRSLSFFIQADHEITHPCLKP